MNEPLNCRRCGGALEAESHAGLCPCCLVQVGITLQMAEDSSVEPSPSAPDTVGGGLPRRFGDYELLAPIARGGMGLVYRARHAPLNRIVALKMILAGELATPRMVLRFRAEAEAAANLHHPHIVAIYETGEVDGQHYFAMEHVAGADLGRLVAKGPLPARRAARYLESIAQAVEYAHQQGVLHRDLKPSNVLIDEQDQPRVTDFGLAKKFTADSDLTLSGQLLGSPNFMPPEQASSKRGQVGRRSDVYGLGALLYHLLTGRPPFQAASLEETLQQVFEREPVSPRALTPGVPRDLETICLKCLEKEPSRRYATAQAVADELGRLLRGEPIQARPVSPPERLWRWCRRNPGLAALGAIVNLLLVVLALGGFTMAHHQRELATKYLGLAETNRVLLYASELKAAQQAIEEGNMANAVAFLEHQIPTEPDQDDLREFTWRYLNRFCKRYRDTPFLDQGVDVMWLAATRDGKWLAAGGGTDLLTVWDLQSRSQIQPRGFRTGDPLWTGPLAFSPDSRFLVASGLMEGWSLQGVQIWDTTSWERVHQPGFAGAYCDFSPNGRLLAVPVETKVVLLQVGGNWGEVQRLTGHSDFVWSARFSSGGERIATTSADRTARLWSVASGECLGVFTNHTDGVMAAVFSPDGKQIASASQDRTIRLWDAESLHEYEYYEHAVALGALDFSADSNRWLVASGGHDGSVKVWDVGANRVWKMRGHSARVMAVKFIPGQAKLASASQDHTIRLWDLTHEPPNDVVEGRAGVRHSPIAFAPRGRLLATVNSNATEILLWNSATGRPAATQAEVLTNRLGQLADPRNLLSPEEAGGAAAATITNIIIDDLAFSPADGSLVVARSFDLITRQATEKRHRIEFWDVRHGIMTNSFAGQAPLCVSHNGVRLACLDPGEGTTLLIHDLVSHRVWATGQKIPRMGQVGVGLDFSPDGEILASSGVEIRLWEAATGKLIRILSSIKDWPVQPPLHTLAFAPNSKLLIAAGEAAEIRVWELSNPQQPLHKLRGHVETVRSLAFSPDSRTLATGDLNGLVKLWSLEWFSGRFAVRELLTRREHQDSVVNLQFSPDGNILVSGDEGGTVRLWRVEPQAR